MVKVVRDMENKIPIKVVSLIDISGFSAELEVNGVSKSVDNLASSSPYIVLSAAETAALEPSAMGRLTVCNKKGEVHVVYKINFVVVDSQNEVQSFRPIRIVIVSSFKYDGPSGSSDEEIARKVEETLDEVLDDKVATSIDGMIDPKVEAAVDAVIDDKVEEQVNALFDSSDSDTIGGAFNELQGKVVDDLDPRLTIVESSMDTDIRPRLEAAESTLEKKVSLDYEDSDAHVTFYEGREQQIEEVDP